MEYGRGYCFENLLSGDSEIDLFQGQQFGVVPLVSTGGFADCSDMEYLDFSQPWWNNPYMDSLRVGSNARYFLVGDYFMSVLQMAHVLYYNKDICRNHFGDGDALYQHVLDGTWTIDQMAEISKAVYSDLNQNGKTDLEDQLGYLTFRGYASVDPFMYMGGIPFTERDEDGKITLNLKNDRAVVLAEKVVNFFHQEGSLFDLNDVSIIKEFMAGKTLFLGTSQLSSASALREMKSDYGFLPYPKLDEAQDRYYSLAADIALPGAVNASSVNLDIAGAVIEALCAETYRSVTPVWYEKALKIKYSRDDISSQIIDVIHDSLYTDFIYAFSPSLNNVGVVLRDLVVANNTGYMSKIAKMEKSVQKSLEKLEESYRQLEEG